jgi:hypothetical protein
MLGLSGLLTIHKLPEPGTLSSPLYAWLLMQTQAMDGGSCFADSRQQFSSREHAYVCLPSAGEVWCTMQAATFLRSLLYPDKATLWDF